MSDLKQAVDQIKRFAPMMQAVIDIADAVDGLTNIDQAVGEKQILLNGLADDIAKQAKALDVSKAKAAQIIADAADKAAATGAAATEAAQKCVDAAAAELADAKSEAAAIKQGAQDMLSAAKAKVSDMAAAVDAKAQELADIEAKIERARSKTVEILGGVS